MEIPGKICILINLTWQGEIVYSLFSERLASRYINPPKDIGFP